MIETTATSLHRRGERLYRKGIMPCMLLLLTNSLTDGSFVSHRNNYYESIVASSPNSMAYSSRYIPPRTNRHVQLSSQAQSQDQSKQREQNKGIQSNIYTDDEDDEDEWNEASQEVYFDVDECVLGDCCHLVSSRNTLSSVYSTNDSTNSGFAGEVATRHSTSAIDPSLEQSINTLINQSLTFLPILTPILAFTTYETVAKMFEMMIEILAQRNWVAVDGGAYQMKILTPAINGIVVPSISILFATLISNTVATLRQRQLDVRTTLNTEAGDIRALVSMVDSFPLPSFSDYQDRCRSYLLQYTTRIIAESQSGVKINSLDFTGSLDSEMNGFLSQLNEMNSFEYEEQDCHIGAPATNIPPHISNECYGALTRLNSLRSTRISALQSTFPPLHYAILLMLAGSICITFLIESNQELLYFLNAVQLKILWTMLIGTFSALGVVCYDLSDPFRGSYEISTCVDQLYTIKDTLRATAQMKEAAISKSKKEIQQST